MGANTLIDNRFGIDDGILASMMKNSSLFYSPPVVSPKKVSLDDDSEALIPAAACGFHRVDDKDYCIDLKSLSEHTLKNRRIIEADFHQLKRQINDELYLLRYKLLTLLTQEKIKQLQETLYHAWCMAVMLYGYHSHKADTNAYEYTNAIAEYSDLLTKLRDKNKPKPAVIFSNLDNEEGLDDDVKANFDGDKESKAVQQNGEYFESDSLRVFGIDLPRPQMALWVNSYKPAVEETIHKPKFKERFAYDLNSLGNGVLDFIGAEINSKRLTWVWTQGFWDGLFNVTNNSAATAQLNTANYAMGTFAYCLYFFRLGFNIAMAVKQAKQAASEDNSASFWTHLGDQLWERKYLIANDIIWGVVNAITFLVLKGIAGDALTIALLCGDAGLGAVRLAETYVYYKNDVKELSGRLINTSKEIEEALNSNEVNASKIRQLLARKKALMQELDTVEDKWADDKSKVIGDVVVSSLYILSFTMMTGFLSLVPALGLSGVILLGAAGSLALDMVSTLGSSCRKMVTSFHDDVKKIRAEIKVKQQQRGVIDTKLGEDGKAHDFESLTSLKYRRSQLIQELGYHYGLKRISRTVHPFHTDGWSWESIEQKRIDELLAQYNKLESKDRTPTLNGLDAQLRELTQQINDEERRQKLDTKNSRTEGEASELVHLNVKRKSIQQRLEALDTVIDSEKNNGMKMRLILKRESLEQQLSLPRQIKRIDDQIQSYIDDNLQDVDFDDVRDPVNGWLSNDALDSLDANYNDPALKVLLDKRKLKQQSLKVLKDEFDDAGKHRDLEKKISASRGKGYHAAFDFVTAGAFASAFTVAVGFACINPAVGLGIIGGLAALYVTVRLAHWGYKKYEARANKEAAEPPLSFDNVTFEAPVDDCLNVDELAVQDVDVVNVDVDDDVLVKVKEEELVDKSDAFDTGPLSFNALDLSSTVEKGDDYSIEDRTTTRLVDLDLATSNPLSFFGRTNAKNDAIINPAGANRFQRIKSQ